MQNNREREGETEKKLGPKTNNRSFSSQKKIREIELFLQILKGGQYW